MVSALAAVLVLAQAAATDAGTPPPTPRMVAYVGATLIDGTGGPGRPGTSLLVRGERIVSLVEGPVAAGPTVDVVDVHGTFIVPGLINSHVHVATEADPAAARAYLRRELYSGVTAVRDMAGDARLLAELQREALTGEIASPDVFYAALMAGPDFFSDPRTHTSAVGLVPGQAPYLQAITGRTDLRLAVAEARGTGATGIKLYAALPASLVRAVTAEAHRQKMLVWAHGHPRPALPGEVVSSGVDVVSHACHLAAELIHPRPRPGEHPLIPIAVAMGPGAGLSPLFAEMKRRGTIFDPTLAIYDFVDDPVSRSCPAGVADHIVHEAHRAGVALSVGTDDDADWKEPDSAIHLELRTLVERAGLSPSAALHAATLIGARTIGRDAEMGTLAAGKLANFVVVEGNPLEDITQLRRVRLVVKRGVVYRRSDYTPLTSAPHARSAP